MITRRSFLLYSGAATCMVLGMIAFWILKEDRAFRPSPEVTLKGDFLFYKGSPLTGMLEEHFDAVETIRLTHFKKGLEDGVQEERTKNGQLVARRVYSLGKKVGTHEGWYPDGGRRFLYDFAADQRHGESWEWYPSGALAMYVRFDHGRVLGKKMWRETGQIYMNFVFPEGRPVGLPGTHLCYQVRQSPESQ